MSDFKKHVLISAGIICASFVVAAVAVSWVINDLTQHASAIVEKRTAIREQARLVEILAAFKEIAPRVQMYESRLAALIPPKDQLLDFPRWIEQLARQHQITQTFSFQGEPVAPSSPSLGAAGFQLTASGAPTNLVRFFQQLETESSRFLIRLGQYEVTKLESGYHVKTSGEVFFR